MKLRNPEDSKIFIHVAEKGGVAPATKNKNLSGKVHLRSCWVMKCRVIYATDTRTTITQMQLNGLVASDSKLRTKKGVKQMTSPKSPARAAPEARRRLSPLRTRLLSPPFRPSRCHGYRLLSERLCPHLVSELFSMAVRATPSSWSLDSDSVGRLLCPPVPPRPPHSGKTCRHLQLPRWPSGATNLPLRLLTPGAFCASSLCFFLRLSSSRCSTAADVFLLPCFLSLPASTRAT